MTEIKSSGFARSVDEFVDFYSNFDGYEQAFDSVWTALINERQSNELNFLVMPTLYEGSSFENLATVLSITEEETRKKLTNDENRPLEIIDELFYLVDGLNNEQKRKALKVSIAGELECQIDLGLEIEKRGLKEDLEERLPRIYSRITYLEEAWAVLMASASPNGKER